MKIGLKLLAGVFFSSILFFATERPVFALDNNEISDTCTVTFNQTAGKTNSGEALTAPANAQEGQDGVFVNEAYWNVTIQLGADAAAHYARCTQNGSNSGGLKLSTTTGGDDSFWGLGEGISWTNLNLTGAGAGFTGRLVLAQNDDTRGDKKWKVDVEMRDGDSENGACDDHEPICKRVYVKYDAYNFEDGTADSCSAQQADVAAYIDDTPNSFQLGQAVSYNIPLSDALRQNCNLDGSRYKFVRLDSQREEDVSFTSVRPLSSTARISYTPDRVGVWRFVYQITRQGACADMGCDTDEVRTFTKDFCVSGDPSQPCTPPTPRPGGTDTVPFNLCQQIAIPNDAQQAAMRAKGVPASEVTARVARLTREKTQCCQCAGGNLPAGATECEEVSAVTATSGGGGGGGGNGSSSQGIYTAVGCIGSSTESIVTSFVKIGLGIAGGVALLMILAGGFMYTTSQGEPKRAGEAKDLITSAVMGLLFIIFSVTILQFIGVSILKIPGFGS